MRFGLLFTLLISMTACGDSLKKTEKNFIDFIARYEKIIVPVETEIDRIMWTYSRTGKEACLQKIDSLDDIRINILHDGKQFDYLTRLRDEDKIKDEYLRRQLEVLYRQYLPCQADIALQKRINSLQIRLKHNVLKQAKNRPSENVAETSDETPAFNHSFMQDSLLVLVKLRNQLAKEVGFSDYYALQFFMEEQDLEKMDALFEKLEIQTDVPFSKIKHTLPYSWHYRGVFSRYGQRYTSMKRNDIYQYVNMPRLAVRFFSGIGLELDDVMANSDFSRCLRKLPVFRCVSIGRKDDIRIIGKLSGTETDMLRLLACCGEAVYWEYIPVTLPYLLRCPSSSMIQMGVSAFFSRLIGYPNWLLSMGVFSAGQAGELRGSTYREFLSEQLFFCRWSLLMYNFERHLYANPDRDLSSLWDELNCRYLQWEADNGNLEHTAKGKDVFAERSQWNTEPYFFIDACHVHNYLLAELWAAQLTEHLCRIYPKLGDPCNLDLIGCAEVGNYLKEFIFESGAGRSWKEITRAATGKDLSSDSFVEQFCQVRE